MGFLYLNKEDERILELVKTGLYKTGLLSDKTGDFEEKNNA